MDKITENELAYIINQKETTDKNWVEITEKYNKKFNKNRDFECVKKYYQRYHNYFNEADNHVKTLKQIHNTKRNSSFTSKENRTILEHWTEREDLIETISNIVEKFSITKIVIPKIVSKKGTPPKEKMILEQLLSDLHFGKLIKDEAGVVKVNAKEIRRRIQKITKQILKEIERDRQYFDVEKIVLAMMGDMIESSHMHEAESLKGCEFGTSKQIFECIDCLFHDLFLPLAQTGIEISVPCVTGNHDRLSRDNTYVQPGEDNLTYVIYKTLSMLCDKAGLKNVRFNITNKLYICTEIYGNNVVYEHGNEVKNLNRDTLVNMLNKRQTQIGKIVNFYRIGHWHEKVEYGQGRIQVNSSVPGQDDYSESKGFDSEALQILNSYVKTDKRKTCFFRSFPIYLEEIK